MVSRLRSLIWAYGVAGGVCWLLYVQSSSPLVKAVLLCMLSGSALAAIVVGVIVHRPRHPLAWSLVGGLQLAWTVGWLFWESRIVSTGMPPAPQSLINFLFLAGYPLLVAALLLLVRQREGTWIGVIDVGVVAGALFVVAWSLLLHRYADDPAAAVSAQANQIAYGIADIVVVSVVLRLIAGGGNLVPALRLLLIGATLLITSDFIWNWSTQIDSYTPGAWADSGWLLGTLCVGLSALLPSSATLHGHDKQKMRRLDMDRGRLLLVLLATLVGPAQILYVLVARDVSRDELLVLVTATGLVSVLMVVRLALNLGEAARLSEQVDRKNRRLAELAAIVHSTSDAVIAATRDRKITAWNRAAERLFGYTEEEALGESMDMLAPGELEEDQVRIHEEIVGENVAMSYETQRAHKDGRLVDVAITLSALRDEADDVVGFSNIIRDISERKSLEEERERTRQRLVEQNQRLQELGRMKDDLVASVSHELRTPLTSIRGYLELVLDRDAGELTPTQEHFLAVVQRNAERLLSVVGDLLFVAQVDAGRISLEPEPVRLDDLAEQALEAARPAAVDKEIELELEKDRVGELVGDRARLAQVLDNLVSNAVKFTPEGGRVSLRTYGEPDRAVFEVTDTGFGISPEDQERLFERFFRTSAAGEHSIHGTGLGLAIVKAIVEAHGGDIAVTSEVGVGSTFRVSVPRERAEAAA